MTKKREIVTTSLLLLNYNIPPTLRTHHKYLICVRIIPGPHHPKNLGSFLSPLDKELAQLACGVPTLDGSEKATFDLHAYVIMKLGDIPAVQKFLNIKGHNSIFPCRSLTVFNREPHSGSGGSEFPAPFRTRKDQRYFSNDRNRFRKVLAPFQTRNCRKHFNRLTISYVRLNLSLPFVTAPITIHYKLYSGPSGGLIRVYLRP